MALLKDYYDQQSNVTTPNAYWKISENNGIVGGKRKLLVKISCFVNKVSSNDESNILFEFHFEFHPNLHTGANLFTQAYNHAKTLPYFSGAIDA